MASLSLLGLEKKNSRPDGSPKRDVSEKKFSRKSEFGFICMTMSGLAWKKGFFCKEVTAELWMKSLAPKGKRLSFLYKLDNGLHGRCV